MAARLIGVRIAEDGSLEDSHSQSSTSMLAGHGALLSGVTSCADDGAAFPASNNTAAVIAVRCLTIGHVFDGLRRGLRTHVDGRPAVEWDQ